MKVFYVHGYGGSVRGDTSVSMKELFTKNNIDFEVLDYSISDLSFPEYIIGSLVNSICSHKDACIIIGSSLGGFFANYVATITKNPCILINPSMHPETSLRKYGLGERSLGKFASLQKFDYEIQRVILIGDKDEIVDPDKNGRTLKGEIITLDMGHRYDNKFDDLLLSKVIELNNNIIDTNSDYK